MKFLQVTSAPYDAIFQDRPKIMRIIARLLDVEEGMKTEQECEAIVNEMSKIAQTPKDIREMLEIDKIYPFLSRFEQMQVLTMLGIQPDPNAPALPPDKMAALGGGATGNPSLPGTRITARLRKPLPAAPVPSAAPAPATT